MGAFDFFWNPNGPLICQAQVFYVYRDRAQYLDSWEEELPPQALASCVAPQPKTIARLRCPNWWPYPGEEDGASYPQLPPGSRVINIRYYVERNGVWNVVPWADGQRFIGDRGSWDSLLSPASYVGKPRSAWANKHGIVPRGARVVSTLAIKQV
jgi:hypothetical protein